MRIEKTWAPRPCRPHRERRTSGGGPKPCISKHPLPDLSVPMKPVLTRRYRRNKACTISSTLFFHPRESIPKSFRTPNPHKENAGREPRVEMCEGRSSATSGWGERSRRTRCQGTVICPTPVRACWRTSALVGPVVVGCRDRVYLMMRFRGA